jgi:hypothetical protein
MYGNFHKFMTTVPEYKFSQTCFLSLAKESLQVFNSSEVSLYQLQSYHFTL